MVFGIICRVIVTIALTCLGSVNSCKLASNSQYSSQYPACSSISPISLEFTINPTLSYLRPTEVGLNDPSVSANPEYFAASAGAIAMTETINEIFQNAGTIHHGPNTLTGISVPILLNQSGGGKCLSWANITVVPQYNLNITDIGVSDTYVYEGMQGITNNRESCQICNSVSPPFALIHGTLNNAGLYDITSQVCNAFNVPTIAVSITDLTFQELYPEAAVSARWSALASIGPTQIGSALNAFTTQFGWHSIIALLDPTNVAQSNEVIRGLQLTGLSISSQFVDYFGTTCSVAIDMIMNGMLSVIYLDLAVNRVSGCVNQLLTSGLLESNYIIIWGPTLMLSVGNNFTALALAAELPLSSFTGTFTLQVRTQDASYYSSLISNIVNVYNTWNDSTLYSSLTPYPTALQDNANSIILASQGIYGFLADKLCSFANAGLNLNIPDNISNLPELVGNLTYKFASVLSSSQPGANYNVISSTSQQNWNVQLNAQNLNIVPNNVFYFYTQNSGYWSEAVNMGRWYHDGLGDSVVIFDVYNLKSTSSASTIGSYISRTYSWVYNSSNIITWPNSSALWQYISGRPGDTPPLTSLSLICSPGFSCSGDITSQLPVYVGMTQIVKYSTKAVISDKGSWKISIQCSGGGGTLFYDVSITETNNPSLLAAWEFSLNQKNAEIQMNFDSTLINPDEWAGGNTLFSFACFDQNNVLNGTLEMIIDNDASQYTPSDLSQNVFIILNSLGIGVTLIGAMLTIFYRHRRPIYSSSIPFLLIAWFGFAVIFGSGILSILPVSGNDVCRAKSWLFNYGFVLVMGSLVLKTFHIHKIFNNDKLIIYRISFWQFMMSLASMLSIVTVIMLVWENDSNLSLHRNSVFQPYCATGSWIPFHIIAGFEFFMILVCLWLSYQIREVHHDYNESKCIGFIVYNTAVWGITWWVISSQISILPSTVSLLTSLFICVVCALNIVIFFAPKFYAIIIEESRGLIVTPNQGSNRLAHSKDSDSANSGIHASTKNHQKSMGKINTFDGEFNLPQEGREALKHARDKLFDTARKWRTNDVEYARLKKKIQECETVRAQDSELINSWMGIIRHILTSGQVSPKDSEGLIVQMWRILSMRGSEIIDEAEKYESSRKKKDIAATASMNIPKASSSALDIVTLSLANSPTTALKPSISNVEMTNINNTVATSANLTGMNNIAQNSSINRRNYI